MSQISPNQIKINAAKFAESHKDARYERGETHTFYDEFFAIFGVKRRQVASFEEPVKKLGNKQGFIDLIWKGVLMVEQKSAGRSLTKAKTQAFDYFPGLKPAELPRYVLACDFQNFELHDLDEDTTVSFRLDELPDYTEHFLFIQGIEKRTFRDQDPVNIVAAELMGRLHKSLLASGYRGHDLERLLVRLLFCLFADDTGIFHPRGIFTNLIEKRTSEDGADLGAWLTSLFEVLNEPETERQTNLDENLSDFPYINGDLFAERLRSPSFNKEMRALLLEACAFNWNAISPAIFGALFESVMNTAERRASGAHYTSEANILKVIRPLFIDDLRAEFERLKARRDTGRRVALERFHDRLASLRFFDPACGCGNFLVIAYREVRALELDVLRALRTDGQLVTDIASLVKVDVGQFYGIEIGEFACRISEVALWMMDHISNVNASYEFGLVFARIPLRSRPNILHGDALAVAWDDVLPAAECDYLFGNPPFIGAKFQSDLQKIQVRNIAALGGSGGTLDFVTAWFIQGAAYSRSAQASGKTVKIGFVATNSITQGEQVAQLWPVLFERHRMEIAFAHRTFNWKSHDSGGAHVHVVIIGLVPRESEPTTKRLFSYPNINGDAFETTPAKLSPYLVDAAPLSNPHVVVREVPRPINGAPQLLSGSQPIDNGNLIMDETGRDELLKTEPLAAPYIYRFVGAEELLNGRKRWILALQDAPPAQLRQMPKVRERLEAVRAYRLTSTRTQTLAIAETPTRYNVNVVPTAPFLAIPKVSSERRKYIPIAYLEPPTVPSDLVFVLKDASIYQFAILTSLMHMAWLREIGGRLKSDFRFSIGIVYNTFPWPDATDAQKAAIGAKAQIVLDERARWADSTLADLYDPLTMPPALRKAHQNLDTAVEKLYRSAPFSSDAERVAHLLGLYENLSSPLAAMMATPQPKRRKSRSKTS